jgi:two-component system heavy metal sensor histidine kinase CusS
MINKNISLKFKLLLYYLIIQIILVAIFSSFLVYMLRTSVKDKVESNLKVIILDIKDDLLEYESLSLEDEINEFQIRPLYIKIKKDQRTIKTQDFPKDIPLYKDITYDTIHFTFVNHKNIATLKFIQDDIEYIIQLSTAPKHFDAYYPNIKYIFLIIIPFIIFFAIIFGNMLISRSFKPIEKLLSEIQNISANKLSSRVTTHNTNDEIDQISKEVNKLLQRVEKSYKQISQFTSDASHELKTPLTIIRGELEVILKEDRQKEEYKKGLINIQSEILNVQKMIENLLFLSKIENDKIKLEDIIYLDETLLDITKELSVLSRAKNSTIDLNIDSAISINGNEELFKIVLKNLINNAIFYSSDNSKINIKLTKDKELAQIEIEDFGIGMSKETLDNIFDKFYRADSSRTKYTGGHGLGMSIVKKICDLHHIDIDIKSELNKGTKVILSFKYLDI